ncbi:hypothetical protein M153_3190005429 [Pseudoloma neurophilia]|uniref:Uncharacterized protein n=1 Tax=Pseudoloma neurophilia TaxID=146866 RepID=A0A0R0LY62_9MICR|nr:hypothetical protein M153_3190005429 [Pseudoloma neurophilia]
MEIFVFLTIFTNFISTAEGQINLYRLLSSSRDLEPKSTSFHHLMIDEYAKQAKIKALRRRYRRLECLQMILGCFKCFSCFSCYKKLEIERDMLLSEIAHIERVATIQTLKRQLANRAKLRRSFSN